MRSRRFAPWSNVNDVYSYTSDAIVCLVSASGHLREEGTREPAATPTWATVQLYVLYGVLPVSRNRNSDSYARTGLHATEQLLQAQRHTRSYNPRLIYSIASALALWLVRRHCHPQYRRDRRHHCLLGAPPLKRTRSSIISAARVLSMKALRQQTWTRSWAGGRNELRVKRVRGACLPSTRPICPLPRRWLLASARQQQVLSTRRRTRSRRVMHPHHGTTKMAATVTLSFGAIRRHASSILG